MPTSIMFQNSPQHIKKKRQTGRNICSIYKRMDIPNTYTKNTETCKHYHNKKDMNGGLTKKY